MIRIALIALTLSALPAQGQDLSDRERAREEIRAEILDSIRRMEIEIRDVQEFRDWQKRIQLISGESRDEALRARLPLQRCLDSSLAELCPMLEALFVEGPALDTHQGPNDDASEVP
ncbi:MAG: hypothetical protein F4213_11835 [Boseongicola sp. SB0677_bin_26]|nr:hypothetical protein [Boseongicola sp. SB0665_bin_10]MYG26696.1 hypothetical protein [Boseongicola sp. SB0677_bin_26]